MFKISKPDQAVVAHAFNASTQEADCRISEFKVSLVYRILTAKPGITEKKNPVSKKPKKNFKVMFVSNNCFTYFVLVYYQSYFYIHLDSFYHV